MRFFVLLLVFYCEENYMRLSRSIIVIFLCLLCTTIAKKNRDDDFAEFEDFDQDEFIIGKFK